MRWSPCATLALILLATAPVRAVFVPGEGGGPTECWIGFSVDGKKPLKLKRARRGTRIVQEACAGACDFSAKVCLNNPGCEAAALTDVHILGPLLLDRPKAATPEAACGRPRAATIPLARGARTARRKLVLMARPEPPARGRDVDVVTLVCRREPRDDLCARCGDGDVGLGEVCDDGNDIDGDGCDRNCTPTGCGNGIRTLGEACDDGNAVDGDGCDANCTPTACGNGVVTAGEECDPPGEGCSVICTEGDGVLGARVMTIRGAFFSSPIGTGTPLGELEGTLELTGGSIDGQGMASVEVSGPTYYSAPILNGQFGLLCVRIDSCSGFVDCDGGTAVDTLMVQDSNGPGLNGLDVSITTGLGEAGPAGTMQVDCMQTFVQLGPGEGDDCLAIEYPAPERAVYTTGTAEAFFINGAPKIGTGRILGSGEPFSCPSWTVTDGPGRLAATYLVEEDPRAGDVANLNVIGD